MGDQLQTLVFSSRAYRRSCSVRAVRGCCRGGVALPGEQRVQEDKEVGSRSAGATNSAILLVLPARDEAYERLGAARTSLSPQLADTSSNDSRRLTDAWRGRPIKLVFVDDSELTRGGSAGSLRRSPGIDLLQRSTT